MLQGHLKDNNNLHRIAISNLNDEEYKLKKWWHNKYKVSPKPLDELTIEEVYIDYLEDWYAKDPSRVEDFYRQSQDFDDWDGELDEVTEQKIAARWAKIKEHHDDGDVLARYRTDGDKDLSDVQVDAILRDLGKNLPGSQAGLSKSSNLTPESIIAESGEFEDLF
jgi:hypothetical protein